MKTILVTGGIGSGKSAVCEILREKGCPVYSADERAKGLYDSDPKLLAAVDKAFGGGLLLPDGKLDRRELAARAFSSPAELARLEALVHPAVLRDFLSWRKSLPSGCGFAVLESAIARKLPEFMAEIDIVVLVDAPEEVRVRRACLRDGASQKEVRARIARQKFPAAPADFVIDNASTPERLRREVERTWKKIVYLHNNNDTSVMKTDLSKILSVSGQHGLYRYLAQARNGIIAESLADGKRTAFDIKSRVTSLGDIAIYTSEGELKLKEVLLKLKDVLGEKEAPTSKDSADAIKALFLKAVPNYDGDRFYVSHMKKVVDWYNEIKKYASLDFAEEEETEAEEPASADPVND